MHISLLPTSSPPKAGPEQALLEANLTWLREELDGARLAEQKAAIRYEIGVLEQLAGRDSIAVRDLLGAVNALARFKEPLELLIVLIERHRSFKNLPTLLEHACRTADSAEEVARAQLAYAWCATLHARDDVRALTAVECALEAIPSDPGALLSLEILARRFDDAGRLRRALEGRHAAATDPTWNGLLAIELAESYISIGEYERANGLLCAAGSADTQVSFRALEQRVALGQTAQRPDWSIDALDMQAQRITEALGPDGSGASVPVSSRSPMLAIDKLLTLARLERAQGRDAAALVALERASRLDPNHAIVRHALWEQAEHGGRHDLAEAIALAEIEAGPTGAEAAALWVRLAESRSARSEHSGALAALRRAIEADPKCWLARALELDLLRGTRDSVGYARALTHVARDVADGAAQSRYWLLAAETWARHALDAEAARWALGHAESSGTPKVLVRRVERALAHASLDPRWYDAATRRLLDSDLENPERVGLELELWRRASLDDNEAETLRRLDALENIREGRLTARVARAYGPGTEARDATGSSSPSLSELEADPARAAALEWAMALRLLVSGHVDAAGERLELVHAQQPHCAALAGTLSVLRLDRPPAAAAVLRTTAKALAEDAFASSLYIEAGLLSWRALEQATARADFEAAEQRGAGCAWALSSWARRATAQGSSGDPIEKLLVALERATASPTPNASDASELSAALRGIGNENSGALVSAARLLNLVLGRSLGVRADPSALEKFAAQNADTSRLAEAWRYLECIGQAEPSPRLLEESTRRWAETSGGLGAALEWLAATERLGNRRRECEARQRVARLVSGTLAEHCRASAALVAHLTQAEPASFLSGTTPQLALTNLETSPPGCDPRRRASALTGVSVMLGEEVEPMLSLLRGYNQLACGDTEAAAVSFRRYTDAHPDDPSGWEGLLSAARSGDDPALLAESAATLGSTSRDPTHAARMFEEAADIFYERLNDEVAGQAALMRAVELDVSRSSSFGRLFQLLRESAAASDLLALIERRLPFASAPAELIELHWERARALRQTDDISGALAALDEVNRNDPNHLGALALSGEIFITLRRYAEAAEKLAEFAARSDAPDEQRLLIGLAAVDLFENQLDSTSRALEVLSSLYRAGLSTLPVRERLARSAAKAEAWDDAVSVLEQLMYERTTSAERAEAARLALAIHRDRRGDPRSAGHAAEVLLASIPHDAEALDLALSGALDRHSTDKLLGIGRSALVALSSRDPTQIDALQRLARIAERLGDVRLRQATLGALMSLGHAPDACRAELLSLERRISTIPPLAMADDVLAELADPEDFGPVPALLSLAAPYLSEALGPTRSTFQVGKRERVAASAGSTVRNEIAAWVGAFTLTDFELYLSPVAAERVLALATEPPSIIIGSGVTAPLGPFQRQELARSLYALRRGLGALVQLEEPDVLALIAALCKLAGVPLEAPTYARQGDFERQLARVLPRKARKLLAPLARPVRDVQASLGTWLRAATASLDRVAAVAVGDASVILAEAAPKERPTAASDERTRRLLSFVLSPQFEGLRERFGANVR